MRRNSPAQLPSAPPLFPSPGIAALPVSQPNPDEQDTRQQRIQEKYELLGILQDRWPRTFPIDFRLVKPFARGLHKEIQKALPEVKPALLWRTIHFYQRGGKGA
jgi:hypothetical protein